MIYMISSELHGKKIEMEMNGQMQHSVKSEMEYRTQQQVDEANKKAVEENRCCDFQTTAPNCWGERTMTDTLKQFAHCSGPYGMRFAEKYDEASWFRARTEFLQKKVWELEEKMEKMRSIAIQLGDDGFCMRCGRWDGTETWDGKGVCKSKTIDGVVVCQECDDEMNECETCNVSMKNEGGCDCQIVVCVNCGIGGEKYNHHLCDDGELRCDECKDGATDDEEEESEDEDSDPYDPMRQVGNKCQGSDCENKLTTEHECRALMCLSCIEQWRIHDEEEMKRYRSKQ